MMDNPQDQSGAANPTNTGRNSQRQPGAAGTARPMGNSESMASGIAATARKSPAVPAMQQTDPIADNANQAAAGAAHPAEAQSATHPEGSLLDAARQSGKQWIEGSRVRNSINQLPQSIKDLSSRAAARVGDLSTTQKVMGGALLAMGLGWLATRKGRTEDDSASYNYDPANAGSYGRKQSGYQAPDAAAGPPATNTSDSGSPYGSGSRYGGGYTMSGPDINASAATDHDMPDSRAPHNPADLRRGTE